ncbi:helix-turn-helix transcriptional regulator [Nocardioides euryhalodurans]|nr:helix-turn-helix transcriptional regulator [Nocardioides euryhalodurans]
MPTVRLSEPRQVALTALLALEPAPDSARADRHPDRRTLEALGRLIPCDVIGLGVVDADTGTLLYSVSLPSWRAWVHDEGLDEECPEGVLHELDDPRFRPQLVRTGMSDGLLLCFRDGRDRVVQVWLDRERRPFTEADLALLRMTEPILRRLLRERPTLRLHADLTTQERRVLRLVATGMSNADVAARMSVAPCTVRKHLEHAYRKLGVTNRMAAVQAFEGRPAYAVTRGQTFA